MCLTGRSRSSGGSAPRNDGCQGTLRSPALTAVGGRGRPSSPARGEGHLGGTLPVVVDRLRPYALHLYLLAYAPAMLFADGALRDLGPQLALGVVTFAA